ncbi:MAG: TRAP transporter small permease subunit [Candidatus Sedimenticola endophacoides]
MSLLKLEQALYRFADWLGILAASLFVLLLFNVFYDVIMRYAFNDVSIGMQELEWHLYATIFLLGVPYALRHGGHVRVDVIFDRLSLRHKAWIDLIGTVVFLLPFVGLVAWYGVNFTIESWELGERSGDPGGLPYRWIIKGMIPTAFTFTALTGIGMLLHSINTLRGLHPDKPQEDLFHQDLN